MKRLFLIAAAVLFAFSALNAQEVQKINKKNLVIKEWNTDPKGGAKALDHVTTYSPDGKKLELANALDKKVIQISDERWPKYQELCEKRSELLNKLSKKLYGSYQ